MNTVQKVSMGVIAIAMATTLVLPGRQTPRVINAFQRLTTRTLGTAMGTRRG